MSTAIYKLSELFARAGVATADGAAIPTIQITSLTDDSREVANGSCFVAVPGTVSDGALFVGAAVAAGAAAVVVGPKIDAGRAGPVIRVADPREALARLAAAHYGLRGGATGKALKLIGVTGTNGKTTVTWLLRAILRAAGHNAALLGTIEYDLVGERRAAPLTTPGALALCKHLAEAHAAGASHGVFEVSSHALDQRRCDGLTFAAAVFTNITGDHLDYHKTKDAYAAAKRRLFTMLPPDAAAIVNADDPLGESFADASAAPAVLFGIDAETAEVRAHIVQMDRSGTRLVVNGRRNRIELRTALVGKHNVSNMLAAAATAEALGIAPDAIREGLEGVSGVPGRLQNVEPEGCPFAVFVDYAHTDDALRNVLRAVRPITPGRLICVFGCGGDRDRTKRPRMAAAVGGLADIALVTSDNPRTEDPNEIIREILPGFAGLERCRVAVDADRRTAIEAAIAQACPGDTVLIAGKGHENYQLVGDCVFHFDDVEVARAALKPEGTGGAPVISTNQLMEERVA